MAAIVGPVPLAAEPTADSTQSKTDMAATVDPAPLAAEPTALSSELVLPSSPISSSPPKIDMAAAPHHPFPDKFPPYKILLHERLQQIGQQPPVYEFDQHGPAHLQEFTSTVNVGGTRFQSVCRHRRRREAAQDAAKVAYENLFENLVTERIDDDLENLPGLISQGVIFCKSILNEFAINIKATKPIYLVQQEGLANMPLFVSNVSFDKKNYTGEAARTKKDAEQNAALSILVAGNASMQQIIRSKKRQIVDITSPREDVPGTSNKHAKQEGITDT